MPKGKQKSVPQPEVLRLVKTLQPVSLVREMDQTILASGGAYTGRDDFIAEAIRDRIAEEHGREAGGGPAPIVVLEDLRSISELVTATSFESPPEGVPTLPRVEVTEGLYGLHNRDYPTLWAAASLASMVGATGRPVLWSAFRSRVIDAAWSLGGQLAKLDIERQRGMMKAGIGFPTNAEKKESAESRFAEHMVGVIRQDGSPRGPLFALGLAGLDPAEGAERERGVAPTASTLDLLRALARAPFSARPPHTEKAWRAFGAHLRAQAPVEYRTWMDVLEPIEAGVAREQLAHGFRSRWPGNAAETNVYGYVSRAREWGLVEAQLAQGEYRITDRGVEALRELRRT